MIDYHNQTAITRLWKKNEMDSMIMRDELRKHYKKESNEGLVGDFRGLTSNLVYAEFDLALHKIRIQVIRELLEERKIK